MWSGYCRPRRSVRLFRAVAVALVSLLCTIGSLSHPMAAMAAPWSPIGPPATDVLTLVADPLHPERLYAGTLLGGVYRSENGGLSWTRGSLNLPPDVSGLGYPRIYSIAVDPGNSDQVYVSTTVGLFRSSDRGITLTELPKPTVTGGTFNMLLTIPARPGELFAANTGFNGGYVYRSLDNGVSWSQHTQGMFGTTQALAVDGNGLCATTSTGFYRRAAVGNWVRIGDSPSGTPWDLAVVSGAMYLTTTDGCFASEDGGAHWSPVALPEIGPLFRIGQDGVGTAYLAGRGRFARIATDRVAMEINDTDFPFTTCTGLVAVGSTLVAGTSMGIYRTDDGGLTWRPSHEGIINSDILPIAADLNDPDYFYVASGQLCDSGIYLTTDGGQTWSQRGLRMTNTDVRSLVVHPLDRNIVLAGTGNRLEVDGQNGGIWKSTDAGLTWRNVTIGDFPDYGRLVLDIQYSPADPNVIYACVVGLFHGFYKSLDGGETWTRKSEGLESMPEGADEDASFINYFATLALAIDPFDPQHLYMAQGGCWGAVNISYDGGENWIRKAHDKGTPGLPVGVGLELFKVIVDPLDPNIVYAAGHSNPPVGVYKTTDGGNSWTALEPRVTGAFMSNGLVMHPQNRNRLYVATRDGVWTTENAGGHWTAMNDGIPQLARFGRSVFIHPLAPERMFYGSGTSGLFVRQLDPETPIVLSRFSATLEADGDVRIAWETASATEHAGFHLDRAALAADGRELERVRLTERMITGAGPGHTFLDPAVPAGRYHYRLVDVSRSGIETTHGPLLITVSGVTPARPVLSAAPNPTSGRTVLRIQQATAGRAALDLFDSGGRRVVRLLDGTLSAGPHEIVWDGRTEAGAAAPSGAYFARFTSAAGAARTFKLLLRR